MRQTFIGLALLMFIMSIGQVRKLLRENEQPFSWQSGSLADIAKEVIAIPLQDSGKRQITEAASVRLEGDNLFLISEETLYRFTRKGEFVCAITRPEEMRVAGYVIDPVQRQLIVFGNVNDIFYYTFDGELLRCKKLTSDFGNKRQLYAAVYHKGHVLTVEAAAAKQEKQLYQRELVEYDTTFQLISARAIQPMSLMRTDEPIGYLPPIVAIDSSSEQPYAYAPSLQPQHLLRDTLFLWQKRQQLAILEQGEADCPLLPIRMGRRFWIASYRSSSDGEQGYTFCYDTLKGHYWQTEDGLEDDFYHTGKVGLLEAMDPYGDCYCFSCLAQQMEQSLSTANDLVLFLVTLKA